MTQDTSKYKRLWAYLKPYYRFQGLTFLVMVILTGLTLALPGAIQYMIDTLIPNLAAKSEQPLDLTPVLLFGGFLLTIYLLDLLFSWLRDYLSSYVGAEIIKDIRMQLFTHLERLSLRFHGSHQTGEIMSRLLSDVGRLQDLLTVTMLMLFTNVLMLVGILAYLLHTNWILTLVAIIPVPLTVLTTNRLGHRLNRLMVKVQQAMADFSAKLQESLLGIKTIQAYGQEYREADKVNTILKGINPLLVKASVTSSLGVNLAQFINMTGPIIVLAWGVYLVATGNMKLGELIAFYILLTYLYSPVRGLAETHIQVQSAMASADRIFEYLDIMPDIVEADRPINLDTVRGEIALKKVSFSYNDNGFRLDDFSLSVRAREKVALVGPSGSGKTTIINLIVRLFDPQAGSVSIDGIDLRNLSLACLRRQVALVEQEPLLFRMSIFENIAYGKSDAGETEVVEAAKTANIHDFIMGLPDGYQTEIGERGLTLSGGERQRLCLARAVVTRPSILILDEATSALDSNSEQLIQQALKEILVDRTAIIIAHRLATVQHADRIVTLKNGRVIDQGTHEELIGRCSLYNELAQNQMLK